MNKSLATVKTSEKRRKADLLRSWQGREPKTILSW